VHPLHNASLFSADLHLYDDIGERCMHLEEADAFFMGRAKTELTNELAVYAAHYS